MTEETHDPKEVKTRHEQLKKIKDEVINLKESPLYKERIKNNVHPVIGEGNHFAKIMFVGEAPGKNEAEQGRPFCGASGRILDELLASIELPRQSVYVTNIVKDRPTDNRDPLPNEIELYGPFLDRQIEIIQPKVIATLGRFSMVYVMRMFGLESQLEPISKAHGKSFDAKARFGSLKVVPLYHPAVALYNGSTKSELMKDFKVLADLV
jgi:DNA polymerase